MNEDIQDALIELEKQLNSLQSARELIEKITNESNNEKERVKDLVSTIASQNNELNEYFKKWLENINLETDSSLDKFKEKIEVGVKEIEGSINTLKEKNSVLFEKYEAIWERHNNNVERLSASKEALITKSEALIDRIDDINFPKRLDTIEEKIELLKKNQTSKFQSVSESIQDISNKIGLQESKSKVRFIVTLVGIILIFVFQLVVYFMSSSS